MKWTIIFMMLLMCTAVSAATLRTIEPIAVEPVIAPVVEPVVEPVAVAPVMPVDPIEYPIDPLDDSGDEYPVDTLDQTEEVVFHKVPVSEEEVLDINKEGADPDGYFEKGHVDLPPPPDVDEPDKWKEPVGLAGEESEDDGPIPPTPSRSKGNPQPWQPEQKMPVDPIEMPPEPLDDTEMPPDPLEHEELVENKYPENKPGVFSRMWAGIVFVFTGRNNAPKDKFAEAMEDSDVTQYPGHARYGSGPDTDEDAGSGKYYSSKLDIDADIGLDERSMDGKGGKSLDGKGGDIGPADDLQDLHEQEEHQTFWARVKSWFSVNDYGYHDLPEVDDEVPEQNLEPAGELAEEDMMELDDSMQRKQQMVQIQSEMMNRTSETQEEIVGNMK